MIGHTKTYGNREIIAPTRSIKTVYTTALKASDQTFKSISYPHNPTQLKMMYLHLSVQDRCRKDFTGKRFARSFWKFWMHGAVRTKLETIIGSRL